ncbi:MAG: hypothetical protein EA426_18725 [Spirochaetaceae bacterium]|nr:MAG: hypothetical protein EA426_18725 [Spirochaetaceae bacterium]
MIDGDEHQEQSGVGALAGVALSSDSSSAFGHVRVLGVPDSGLEDALYAVFDGLGVSSGAVSESWSTVVPVVEHAGVYYLPVPMFAPDGGAVTVVVTDGHARSATLELTVEPLPPRRHGALDEIIDALDGLLAAATESRGLQYPDEWVGWRDNLDGMPTQLWPLMEAWTVTLDEANPESLVAMSFTVEGLELVERMLADDRMIATVQAAEASLLSVPEAFASALDASRVSSHTSVPHRTSSTDASPARSTYGTVVDGVVRVPGEPEITTPEQLALFLETYRSVVQLEQNIELLDEVLLSHVSTIATIGALSVSGPAGGAVLSAGTRAAMAAVVKAAKALGGTAGVSRWFLPCCLRELEVELDPPGALIPVEDGEPNQVRLTSARVVAESEGVNVAREMVERLIGAIGGRVEKAFINPAVTSHLNETVADLSGDFGLTQAARDFAGEQLADVRALVFEWTDIDVMGDEPQKWLRHQVATIDGVGAPIIEYAPTDTDRYEFRLRAPQAFARQDSVLRFLTDSDVLRASAAIDTVLVDLRYVRVVFGIERLRLSIDDFDAGQPIPVPVRIDHTVLRGVELEAVLDVRLDPEFPAAGVGSVRISPGSCVGTECVVEYIPGDPDGFPSNGVLLYAEFIGDGGIRGHSEAPPRVGVTSIVFDRPDIEVVPADGCVPWDESLQFSAREADDGEWVPHSDVVWSVTVGSISSGGLFTAPAEGVGEARIRATLVVDPDVWAEATITYGLCDGESFFELSGPVNRKEDSLHTYFFDDGAPELWMLTLSGPVHLLQFESNQLVPVTGGVYQVNDSFASGTFFAALIPHDEDADEIEIRSGTISFSNVTPEFAVGTFDLYADDNLRVQGVFLAEPYTF